MLFHIVEDSRVILRSKGVWKQADLYQRNQELYAQWGSGFIGLRCAGGTTLPSVSWDCIDSKREWKVIPMGKLELIPHKEIVDDGTQPITAISESPNRGDADIKAVPARRKPRAK